MLPEGETPLTMDLSLRCKEVLAIVVIAAGLPSFANASLNGDTLGWQYYAYGGPYSTGGGSDPSGGGTFVVNGPGSTEVNGVFTTVGNNTYFNIVATPTTITFDYSPLNAKTSTTWSPSPLSLAPTIYNGIAINMISGDSFRNVTMDPATNMIGFNKSDISFTGSQIQVNWANLSFNSSTRVTLDVSSAQTVYLDFKDNPSAQYNLNGMLSNTSVVYSKPDAGLSAPQVSQVLSSVQGIYSGYNVNFTATQPTSGPYETIYIGGTPANITASDPSIVIPSNTLGIAQAINVMDSNPNDTAVVFAGNAGFTGNTPLLAQVIAHETGHLLGLEHVLPTTELLYPFGSAAATGISSNNEPVALIDSYGNVVPASPGWIQNSAGDLLCAVGSTLSGTSCATADSLTSLLVRTSSLSTIYNARLVLVAPGGGSSDIGVTEEDLGSIQPGVLDSLLFPEFVGEKVILEGSATPDGITNIFAGPTSGIIGDPNDPNTFAFLLSSLDNLDLYELNQNGSYTNLGSVELTGQADGASVPEPGSLALLLSGISFVILIVRRQDI